MGPNLSSYILNRVLQFTVDQKKQERICVLCFSPKSLFQFQGNSCQVLREANILNFLTTLPLPTLQSYFKLGYRPFPEPFHLCAFPHASHSLYQPVVPFLTLPSSKSQSFSASRLISQVNFSMKPFPILQASCYLSFLWISQTHDLEATAHVTCSFDSWVWPLNKLLCFISPESISFLRAGMKAHVQTPSTVPGTWGHSINI